MFQPRKSIDRSAWLAIRYQQEIPQLNSYLEDLECSRQLLPSSSGHYKKPHPTAISYFNLHGHWYSSVTKIAGYRHFKMNTHQLIGIFTLLISWQSCDGNISEFNSRLDTGTARRATELTAGQWRELHRSSNVLKSLLESASVEQDMQNAKERWVAWTK